MDQTRRDTAPRVRLACIPCRSKHVRCDATQPTCKRCRSDGRACQYVRSRRGGLDRAQLAARRNRRSTASSVAADQLPCSSLPPPTPPTSGLGVSRPCLGYGEVRLPETRPEDPPGDTRLELLHFDAGCYDMATDTLIHHYYKFFHKSHPCVLPRWRLEQQYNMTSENRGTLKPLVSAMRYIGSLYAWPERASHLREQAMEAIRESEEERIPSLSPWMTQCRLILSVALFWCGDKVQSRKELDTAINAALKLAMFHRRFSRDHGNGDAVLEESWRRTWWQLYLVDSWFAAIRREITFRTLDTDATVDLPCGEDEYEAGAIPPPKTLQDFEDREFAPEPPVYSSFAYLIGAARGAALAKAALPSDPASWSSRQILAEVDANAEGWLLLLPDCKREILGSNGQIDELMFQAHMAIHTSIIVLHRPFSALIFHPLERISGCSTDPPARLPVPESMTVHTTRCLRAIEAEIRLLTLPSPQLYHSAFTICMITEAAIPLLSACKFLFAGQKHLSIARSQIRLIIGCLKCLAQAWPRAATNMAELQCIAREVLKIGQPVTPCEDMTDSSSSAEICLSGSDAGAKLAQRTTPEFSAESSIWDDLVIPSTFIDNLDALWVTEGMPATLSVGCEMG